MILVLLSRGKHFATHFYIHTIKLTEIVDNGGLLKVTQQNMSGFRYYTYSNMNTHRHTVDADANTTTLMQMFTRMRTCTHTLMQDTPASYRK